MLSRWKLTNRGFETGFGQQWPIPSTDNRPCCRQFQAVLVLYPNKFAIIGYGYCFRKIRVLHLASTMKAIKSDMKMMNNGMCCCCVFSSRG
jgi:hypothetical protein